MTINPKVSRGKSQVLFNFMPGSLIDFPNTKIVARVLEIGSDKVEKPMKRVLDRIYSLINSGKYKSKDISFPQSADISQFRFGEPKFVKCEIYPLVFYSQKSGLVHFFKRIEELDGFVRRADGRLIQKDLVFITPDGDLDQLQPTVDVRKRNIRLVKIGQTQAGYHWIDADTGKDLGQIYGIINNKRINVATPVRAKITHLPQILTLVNIRDYIETETEEEAKKLSLLVLAAYLNLLGGDLNIKNYWNELKSPASDADAKAEKILSVLGMKMENLPEETRKNLMAEASDLSGKIKIAIDQAKEKVPGINLSSIYEDVYEYMDTISSKSKISINDAISRSEGSEKSKFSMFKKKLGTIGIKNATLIEDVPLINAAYGYTRGSFESKDTKLKPFPSDTMDKNKIPIYVNPVTTEAMLLEFDRFAILKWLKDNGMLKGALPVGEAEEKLWFLKNIDPQSITRFGGTSNEGYTKEVFHLIHTISHCLIKQIPEQCGISLDSIGEIIFPNIPAVLIYSKEIGDFRLGAIKDLFENKIHPWVDITVRSLTKCVYDPLCMHDAGACHSCLFIHEGSCAFFNQDLSRHYLIGARAGKFSFGFWKNALEELYESE